MGMSIARALAELKLLDSRIEKKIMGATLVGVTNESSYQMDNCRLTKKEFVAKVEAEFQSIRDLIERRRRIKAAIVASNAITFVTIGGVKMTVAEAIERKASIEYDVSLLKKLKSQLSASKAKVEKVNEDIKNRVDQVVNSTMNNSSGPPPEGLVKMLTEQYNQDYKVEVISMKNVEKVREELEESIENFLFNVDFELSTSNALTVIEVP